MTSSWYKLLVVLGALQTDFYMQQKQMDLLSRDEPHKHNQTPLANQPGSQPNEVKDSGEREREREKSGEK